MNVSPLPNAPTPASVRRCLRCIHKKAGNAGPREPGVTPPPKDNPTSFVRKPKMASKPRKREIPEGLWTKCPKCSHDVVRQGTGRDLKVCSQCLYHFPIGSRERIHSLVETCTFEEMDAQMVSVDALGFTGVATYTSKLEAYQKSTGPEGRGDHRHLQDRRTPGRAGVMDFGFLGGSMGSVVGEKLTRLIERATEKELPLLIISTSGGARMYEGMFSLMQMAKTSAALAYYAKAVCPISAC